MHISSLEILEKTKLPPDQARAILKVMEAELATNHEPLVAKIADLGAKVAALAAKVADLGVKVAALREAFHGLELKLESARSDLVRWVFVCTFGQAALLAGVVYFVLTYVRK